MLCPGRVVPAVTQDLKQRPETPMKECQQPTPSTTSIILAPAAPGKLATPSKKAQRHASQTDSLTPPKKAAAPAAHVPPPPLPFSTAEPNPQKHPANKGYPRLLATASHLGPGPEAQKPTSALPGAAAAAAAEAQAAAAAAASHFAATENSPAPALFQDVLAAALRAKQTGDENAAANAFAAMVSARLAAVAATHTPGPLEADSNFKAGTDALSFAAGLTAPSTKKLPRKAKSADLSYVPKAHVPAPTLTTPPAKVEEEESWLL